MSQSTLKKIQDISTKIHELQQEQDKLRERLEQKIIKTLHTHNAFAYDFETLVSGIEYVLQTIKRSDEEALHICSSWKKINNKVKTLP